MRGSPQWHQTRVSGLATRSSCPAPINFFLACTWHARARAVPRRLGWRQSEEHQDVNAFRQSIRECMIHGVRVLYAVKPEFFGLGDVELKSLTNVYNVCLDGDTLPLDPSVKLASIRQLVKLAGLNGISY
ncbi:hypothetical protein V5799_024121 [Amblyomma americanum]|uniref:Uncharacterized protein n=1 Tax=Amblyomma americanum TaxID=6943 RepID=A0AAQ4ECX9_AMBAM